MSMNDFVVAVCLFTVLAHISLILVRGWIIGGLRNQQRAQWKRMEDHIYQYEQDKKNLDQWTKDFEASHRSPWDTTQKQRVA